MRFRIIMETHELDINKSKLDLQVAASLAHLATIDHTSSIQKLIMKLLLLIKKLLRRRILNRIHPSRKETGNHPVSNFVKGLLRANVCQRSQSPSHHKSLNSLRSQALHKIEQMYFSLALKSLMSEELLLLWDKRLHFY